MQFEVLKNSFTRSLKNSYFYCVSIHFSGSNVERVLRDLAALKTPVTSSTVCSADSPHTPAVYNTFPDWAKPSEVQTNTSDEWWVLNSTYIGSRWCGQSGGYDMDWGTCRVGSENSETDSHIIFIL